MQIILTRKDAETKLKEKFGIEHFYDEQWKSIERILRGERILMIERTGFGKSLCFTSSLPLYLMELRLYFLH